MATTGTSDSSPIMLSEVEVRDGDVKEGKDGVEAVPSTLPDDFRCMGCGNEKSACHQKLFGTFLIQDTLTLYNNSLLSEKPVEIDDDVIHRLFKDKYPEHLQAFVMFHHFEYDEKIDYDLPECLVEGALKKACTLISSKKTMDLLDLNRRYGASYKYFTFSSSHYAATQK